MYILFPIAYNVILFHLVVSLFLFYFCFPSAVINVSPTGQLVLEFPVLSLFHWLPFMSPNLLHSLDIFIFCVNKLSNIFAEPLWLCGWSMSSLTHHMLVCNAVSWIYIQFPGNYITVSSPSTNLQKHNNLELFQSGMKRLNIQTDISLWMSVPSQDSFLECAC